MDEAKAEAEANSHEAEARIVLIFSAKFYVLTPIFSQKPIYTLDRNTIS